MHLLLTFSNYLISILSFPNPVSQWVLRTALLPSEGGLPQSQPLLHLNSKHDFRLAIFSDLHYGEEENGWGIEADLKSTNVMHKILDYDPPDLVVISAFRCLQCLCYLG